MFASLIFADVRFGKYSWLMTTLWFCAGRMAVEKGHVTLRKVKSLDIVSTIEKIVRIML